MNPLLPMEWVQAIGWAAAGISLLSYQFHRRPVVILLQVASCLLLVVHFILLQAPAGAVFNFLALLRGGVALTERPWRRFAVLAFIPILWGTAFATAQDWKDLIPAVAMTCSTLAQASPKILHLRLFMLASSPPWFLFSALSGSQGGMAYEILNSLSNLLGLYRYHLKPRLAEQAAPSD